MVEGVARGDRLVRVGAMETEGATMGSIFRAMHGKPGEVRDLVVERGGKRLTIAVRVTAF